MYAYTCMHAQTGRHTHMDAGTRAHTYLQYENRIITATRIKNLMLLFQGSLCTRCGHTLPDPPGQPNSALVHSRKHPAWNHGAQESHQKWRKHRNKGNTDRQKKFISPGNHSPVPSLPTTTPNSLWTLAPADNSSAATCTNSNSQRQGRERYSVRNVRQKQSGERSVMMRRVDIRC